MMKLTYLKLFLVTILTSLFCSCGSGISDQKSNAEGFKAIENELKSKFGNNAYYTDLSIVNNESIGNSISVTVTKNPESLMMGQWNLSQNSWQQNSEITLEVPKGTKASDFMFQLNERISLTQLGELIEKSSEQLKTDKNLKNPTLSIAHIKFPKNGDLTKTEYAINLKPEKGGTTFSFYYNLNGELIKMDY